MIRSLMAELQQGTGTACPCVLCARFVERDSLLFLQKKSLHVCQQGGQGCNGEQEGCKKGRKVTHISCPALLLGHRYLVALASYLFSALFTLHRASGSPLWILSRVFKSPGRWKLAWRHQVAERDVLWLLFCLSEIPWESHPFQVEEMSPLVSKGGKSSLRERKISESKPRL